MNEILKSVQNLPSSTKAILALSVIFTYGMVELGKLIVNQSDNQQNQKNNYEEI